MTQNEVNLHRSQKGHTALVVVTHIELVNQAGKPIAQGGKVQVEVGWDIDAWEVAPIAYRLLRRAPATACKS